MEGKRFYKEYKKGQVVYADFGKKAPGVEGGLRPGIVVSRNESNHRGAPQITVCPLSSKLKDKLVHVRIQPNDVNGYHLSKVSDLLPEDIQTIPKSAVRGSIGYVTIGSEVQEAIDKALIIQFGLLEVARKMIREEDEDAAEKQGKEIC